MTADGPKRSQRRILFRSRAGENGGSRGHEGERKWKSKKNSGLYIKKVVV